MHQLITVDSGVVYEGGTLGGRTSGPTLRVTQGDTVEVTRINRAPIPHSLDFHAAELAPSRCYTNLLPVIPSATAHIVGGTSERVCQDGSLAIRWRESRPSACRSGVG